MKLGGLRPDYVCRSLPPVQVFARMSQERLNYHTYQPFWLERDSGFGMTFPQSDFRGDRPISSRWSWSSTSALINTFLRQQNAPPTMRKYASSMSLIPTKIQWLVMPVPTVQNIRFSYSPYGGRWCWPSAGNTRQHLNKTLIQWRWNWSWSP